MQLTEKFVYFLKNDRADTNISKLAKRNLPVLLANRSEILCRRFLMKKLMPIIASLVALVLAAGANLSWL
jgi:hypothetical protein